MERGGVQGREGRCRWRGEVCRVERGGAGGEGRCAGWRGEVQGGKEEKKGTRKGGNEVEGKGKGKEEDVRYEC